MFRRSVAMLAALVILIVAGCAGTKPATNPGGGDSKSKKEQVVRVNIGADPQTLDPAVSTGVPEMNVQIHLFEGLMRLDKESRPIPGLAVEMPEVRDNGTTYVFKLRDAKWSNGDPITADDFVWSWQRALDPRTASEYAYQLYYIKGGEALNTVPLKSKSANGEDIDRPEAEIKAEIEEKAAALGVRAVGAKTLEVRLEQPAPYFVSLTSFHTLHPVHRKSVEANSKDWFTKSETLVASGPFKLQSWVPKDRVVLVRNPNYYDAAKVKLERIEYYLSDQESTVTQMYEVGDLDAVHNVNTKELDRLKKERPGELLILPDLGTYFYRFNVTREPLDNPKIRRALTLAIDRQAIVANITKAGQLPATAFVPGGIPDAQGDFRKNGGTFFKDNDLATAKQLLAEAGYPDGKGFPKLTLLYNTNEMHKQLAEAIQQMWKKNLGVDIELTSQEWKVYLQSQSSLNYDISRAGWLGDYVDPMTFADMFITGGGNNSTGWSNKTYDDLINRAKVSNDKKIRMAAMHDAEKILMNELPIMPIYYYVRVRLISPKIKNWAEPITSGFDLREAYVE